MPGSSKPQQGERSAAERGRSLQGHEVHVLLFNLQVTFAKHLQRFLLTGLYYISKRGRDKAEGWAIDQIKSDIQRSCKPPQGERSAAERGRFLQGPLPV